MKVLVACEFSGRVRDAFIAHGHDAISCDLLPSEKPGPHYQGDIAYMPGIHEFDLMIAHPPCTYLCRSGARWWKEREQEQRDAIEFFLWMFSLPIPRIAIENPIGIMSRVYRKPDQIIQPYWFGETFSKATCLWLKDVPPLIATCVEVYHKPSIHYEPPGEKRWKNRSRTPHGIADAMSEQWG